jgi:peptide/nickel transport system permease protein
MLRYLVERLLLMVPTLVAISALIFLVIHLPPGDFVSNQIAELEAQGEQASKTKAEFLRAEYGLDRPMIEQYAMWIGVMPGPRGFSGLLQGEWGWSFEFERPVSEVVGHTLVPTIAINALAVLVIYLVALPLGIVSATRKGSPWDAGISLVVYSAMAIPGFLAALLLLYYSNRWFGMSIGGMMDPAFEGQPWSLAKLGSIAAHLVIPVLVIAAGGAAAMIRRLRANLLDELERPYVIAARARGVSEQKLILKYPVRMALAPFIADIGNLLPNLVSGSVIVSVVLSLPAIGPVLVRALQSQDTFLASFIMLFVAVLTVIGMLISDLILALVDPRIRLGQGVER